MEICSLEHKTKAAFRNYIKRARAIVSNYENGQDTQVLISFEKMNIAFKIFQELERKLTKNGVNFKNVENAAKLIKEASVLNKNIKKLVQYEKSLIMKTLSDLVKSKVKLSNYRSTEEEKSGFKKII